MCRIINDYSVDTVYHLASQSIVKLCNNDPVSSYDININGTVSLLEACRVIGKNTIKSIVVSTSDKVYGHTPPPYDESTVFDPKYIYEVSKACQDMVSSW